MPNAETLTTGGVTYDIRDTSKNPVIGKGVNLLDNWYFGNPDAVIDQRHGYVVPDGVTYYSDTALTTSAGTTSGYLTATYVNTTYGIITVSSTTYYVAYSDMVRGYVGKGYGIDRWKLNATANTLIIGGDYITLTGTLRHYFECPTLFSGKRLTMSALIKGESAGTSTLNFKVYAQELPAYYALYNVTLSGQWQLISHSFTIGTLTNDNKNLDLMFENATNLQINAVKLELGDTQTLAHQENGVWVLNDPPPNYQQELAKCQRYQVVYDGTSEYTFPGNIFYGSGAVMVPCPVPLRANASVSFETTDTNYPKGFIYSSTGLYVCSTLGNTGRAEENIARINVTCSDTSFAGAIAWGMTGNTNSKLILNANL